MGIRNEKIMGTKNKSHTKKLRKKIDKPNKVLLLVSSVKFILHRFTDTVEKYIAFYLTLIS